MPKTFVYTAITVKKQTPVEKSFSAVSNAHPVQPATRPVRISKRNGAADLIGHLDVCNGCPMKINHCTIAHKYRYDARFADRKYRRSIKQFPCRNKYDQASAAPKRSDHYSVDRSGTVTLSDPDQSSGA